tara:strand:+ start:478 stop:1065 length:588 start_codon:yes stop_codon:yes gene_type:complete
MIQNFNDDIIFYILKLFHRFSYLNNLYLTNKYVSVKTKYMYFFHINNFNKCLNIECDTTYKTYLYLSKCLFFDKIINTKKINSIFLNSLHTIYLPTFVKIILLVDEYYDISFFNNVIKILSIENIKQKLLKDNTIYIPFAKLYGNNFIIQIQFLNDLYRIKIQYDNSPISIYKPLNENDILLLITKKKINTLQYF